MRGLWDKAVALELCGQRLNGKNLLLVTACQARAQMLAFSALCRFLISSMRARVAGSGEMPKLFPDQVDPMIVVPDGIDTSFIERQQGQEVPHQFFTVRIEAQRMTGEPNRIVVVVTKP